MSRYFRNTIVWLLIFLVIIGIVTFLNGSHSRVQEMTYSQFRSHLNKNEIVNVKLQPQGGNVFSAEGQYKTKKHGTKKMFKTFVPGTDSALNSIDRKTKLDFSAPEQSGGWLGTIISILPFIIIFALLFFLINQAQGGGGRVMNFGKSKARLYSDEKKKVRFKDVAGADEEKQELVEIVDFLKDPRKFSALGARIPKGVLLVGPPGTGKTLLARAVAGEAGVPFLSISGSDFVEMFVGVGASRVRDLFENAKKNAPCIIFIDEIDAVGRQRGAGLGGGHDEREQTLNQLLVEMDGFGDNEGIIIIAATNRSDILDPALLRPGRFDRQIPVNRPDVRGREDVLKVHARNKPLSPDVDLSIVARSTPGFSGADLENLLNESAIVAARQDKKAIDMEDIDESVERVIAGPAKKGRVISQKERNIVAYHESGHAIIGVTYTSAEATHKVTIIPRGQAGGYTVQLPKEDRFFLTEPELREKIIGLLAGRVAEEIIFGEASTGASNDFQRATDIARRMVTEFGMSNKLGPMQFGQNQSSQVFLGRDIQNESNYSDAIAYEIDTEVQNIIKECYARCQQILTEKREKLELMAQTLLKVETLEADQIHALMETGELIEPKAKRRQLDNDIKVNINTKEDEGEQVSDSPVQTTDETDASSEDDIKE